MRRLRINEVLKLDSFMVVPAFTRPASRVDVTWAHGPVVTLTLCPDVGGDYYLIEWPGGEARVGLRDDTHHKRTNFVCPLCKVDVTFRHLYFDGDKWGCFHCLELDGSNPPGLPKLTEIETETTNDLIKGLTRLLGEN